MNLPTLEKYSKNFSPGQYSPRLTTAIEDGIAQNIGLDTHVRKQWARVQLAFAWGLLGFATITGLLGIAAALKWVTLEAAAFDRIWQAFVVSTVGVIITGLGLAFKNTLRR